jgi:hypothetical protein
MKRGFFVFEPLAVLLFISMVAITAFIVLQNMDDAINAPLGRHALAMSQAYLGAETSAFLPREMKARYAIENAVYVLAAGGGTLPSGKPVTNAGCQYGATAPSPPTVTLSSIPDYPVIATAFSQLVKTGMAAPVGYEFAIDAPLTVSGIPLRPETVTIPNPISNEEQDKAASGSPAFIRGRDYVAQYDPRLAFTVTYDYPLKDVYDQLRAGLQSLDDPADANNCRFLPPSDAKNRCVVQHVQQINTPKIRWSVGVPTSDAPDDYTIVATHNFQMPLCKNQPVTRIRLVLPSIS